MTAEQKELLMMYVIFNSHLMSYELIDKLIEI